MIEAKDQKIRQLESRLALALAECLTAERGDLHPWRRNPGVGRTDSVRGESPTVTSTDESSNHSPVRFSFRSASQRRKRQQNSLKTNSVAVNNASCTKLDTKMNGTSGSTKFTNAIIHQHSHVIGNEGVTPTKGGKSNASSACTVM